ncbi:MAG TPA: sigma-70 family RNA polymerase sigma factor [Verrucomicrobiae bacterium]|jgi:RNA polymerase sigma-70 factor (ECF subfamily)|nr:sigma-70 family RNA polymerase sigma factor [Verrucomicrobiae bacterium]
MPVSQSENSRERGSLTVARFGETHWSVIRSAMDKQRPAGADAALESLCRVYWPPLYAYIRRLGESPHDAQDLTQAFFARFLERDFLAAVDQEKGRFRSFMLAALKHFLSNERDKQRAQKRGGGRSLVPIDFHDAESHCGFEPSQNVTPEIIFQRRWASALLEQALARLRGEYADAGKEVWFEQLKQTLTEGRGTIAYADLAARLKTSEAAVKMAVHRLRQRYREAIRSEIAATVAHPSQIEDELREVLRALSA